MFLRTDKVSNRADDMSDRISGSTVAPDRVRITHIGGPTALIEIGGWTLLTDPTFDEPGKQYYFGYGTGSRKLSGPAVRVRDLPPIDAVLLSHDHHADNLDETGRAMLPTAGRVITTESGARRLGGNASGLAPWSTTKLAHSNRPRIDITATPCRHGPPGSHAIVGDVIGFLLRWEQQTHGAFWISGDTVFYDGVHQVAEHTRIGTILLHLGGVRFPLTGPLRYTMTAHDAVRVSALMKPQTILPIHYEGWKHFQQGREDVERAFADAAPDVGNCVRWLAMGVAETIAV